MSTSEQKAITPASEKKWYQTSARDLTVKDLVGPLVNTATAVGGLALSQNGHSAAGLTVSIVSLAASVGSETANPIVAPVIKAGARELWKKGRDMWGGQSDNKEDHANEGDFRSTVYVSFLS